MENQENNSENTGNNENVEVNPSKLNDNTEIDLDRSGPNEGSSDDNNQEQLDTQSDENNPLQGKPGNAQGYEGNTPDIDDETYLHGRGKEGPGKEFRRQSGNNSGGMGIDQSSSGETRH